MREEKKDGKATRIHARRKTSEEKETISRKNKETETREGITTTRGKRGKGMGERLTAKRGWRFYSEGGWFWRLVTAVGCRKRGWRGGEEGENPRGGWSWSRRVFRRLNQLKRKNSRGKIFETCPARRARSHIHACLFVLVPIERSTARTAFRIVRYREIGFFVICELRSWCRKHALMRTVFNIVTSYKSYVCFRYAYFLLNLNKFDNKVSIWYFLYSLFYYSLPRYIYII